jgi:hypothetical protein
MGFPRLPFSEPSCLVSRFSKELLQLRVLRFGLFQDVEVVSELKSALFLTANVRAFCFASSLAIVWGWD